jgi:hypothetical protein
LSVIHVNQIKNHILNEFGDLIEFLEDEKKLGPEQLDNMRLSRSLAAYSISYFANVGPEIAAKSIVDGYDDNGIDAIFYDEKTKTLYLTQSKWISDGRSEPSNGEIKKFVGGIRDLFNQRFDIFNKKVNEKKDVITKALLDINTQYKIIIVHTGLNFSSHNKRDMDDLQKEMNDANDVLTVTIFNQSRLHDSLKALTSGSPIDLDIGLKEWGKKESPQPGYYGQVNGKEIADWWSKYENKIFAKNLRELLADSEVNSNIRETIEQEPDMFWYYNNGITIVCKKVAKSMAGGSDNAFGTFKCEDVSIVNGAQTVGTIGQYGQLSSYSESLEKLYVHVRIISLDNSDEEFGRNITKNNNRQNKIENRDFVALDSTQQRILTELAIDGINYHITRSTANPKTEKSFDIVESTTALACSNRDTNLAVQAKKEISKLWADLDKIPYRILFNDSVSGLFIWRCVQTQRKIDAAIDELSSKLSNRDNSIAVHGRRIISHLIFQELELNNFKNPSFPFDSYANGINIRDRVVENYELLKDEINKNFESNTVIGVLFKNSGKCNQLVNNILSRKIKPI